jgi:hypothetical protein
VKVPTLDGHFSSARQSRSGESSDNPRSGWSPVGTSSFFSTESFHISVISSSHFPFPTLSSSSSTLLRPQLPFRSVLEFQDHKDEGPRATTNNMATSLSVIPSTSTNISATPPNKTLPADLLYIQYSHAHEKQYLPSIRALISKDLSEPYSIYVYRYFLYHWGDLCFMVFLTERRTGTQES